MILEVDYLFFVLLYSLYNPFFQFDPINIESTIPMVWLSCGYHSSIPYHYITFQIKLAITPSYTIGS